MTSDAGDSEVADRRPADLGAHDAPNPRADAVAVDVDGELVIATPNADGSFNSHWLDARARTIWQCLDGEVTVTELVDDLAAVSGGDVATIERDVVALIQTFGWGGLLEGVAPPRPTTPDRREQVPIGTTLPDQTFSEVGGSEHPIDGLRGRQTLLVNWSPTCGYCREIASDLAEIAAALAEHSDELLLVMPAGEADEHASLAQEAGLACRLVDGDRFATFESMGTPVAYLIGRSIEVTSQLVVGGPGVVALGRMAAGLDSADQ